MTRTSKKTPYSTLVRSPSPLDLTIMAQAPNDFALRYAQLNSELAQATVNAYVMKFTLKNMKLSYEPKQREYIITKPLPLSLFPFIQS